GGLTRDDPDLGASPAKTLLLTAVGGASPPVGGAQLALERQQPETRLLFLGGRGSELAPECVGGLQQAALGAGGASDGGTGRIEIFLQRLHRGFLPYQMLPDPGHLALERGQAPGGITLFPPHPGTAPAT